jgi:hypothetical protein
MTEYESARALQEPRRCFCAKPKTDTLVFRVFIERSPLERAFLLVRVGHELAVEDREPRHFGG